MARSHTSSTFKYACAPRDAESATHCTVRVALALQFHKKMRIHEVMIYTDFKLDESYTPSKVTPARASARALFAALHERTAAMQVSIRAGSTYHDLQEIHVQELSEPSGWVTILPSTLKPPDADGDEADADAADEQPPLRTHFIQVPPCWRFRMRRLRSPWQ